MTSVKEIHVAESPGRGALGQGSFRFTDAYSVFDWGQMPDAIPDKGAALCTMGAFTFELLEAEGVPTHYRGVVVNGADRDAAGDVSDGAICEVDEALDRGPAPTEMAVDLVEVPDLPFDGGYDYDAYHGAAGSNYLVPLEIVFRNRVPVGSSLRARSDPADHGLDADVWPDHAVGLPEPVVEFSTKYEEQDRYLDRSEADRIAGRAAAADLERIAREVNRVVTERAEAVGLVHQDGKIECLFDGGEIRVADVAGTFDENRFSADGQQLSKEVLRQYHKRTQPAWVEAVSAAKAEADERGIADWRSLCDEAPEPLAGHVVDAARDLYCAGANVYLGRDAFDAPGIEAAVAAVGDL
jgi:phosphoribosylaminoimidazole-succinocarboxamide synthase